MEDEKYKVEVNDNYSVVVDFKKSEVLPEGYGFAHESTYEEIYESAEYLQKEYSHLIAMENPQIKIRGGSFQIDGVQSYDLSFYEGSDDVVENIIGYNFNDIYFYGNDNESVRFTRQKNIDLTNVIGNYPIISADEALKFLENGDYITPNAPEFTNLEEVRKVELVYQVGFDEEVYMPYYRFYVELPEYKRDDIGFNSYGIYYVPAVEGQYIENMPIVEFGI